MQTTLFNPELLQDEESQRIKWPEFVHDPTGQTFEVATLNPEFDASILEINEVVNIDDTESDPESSEEGDLLGPV